MNSNCRFEDCEEKPGLFGAPGKCVACGESYCPRHLADGKAARFVRSSLPDVYPSGKGFCIDCIRRHLPDQVKGVIDRKCSKTECLRPTKRLCSYCARWFCGDHFLTRDNLTTELLSNLKKFRKIDGDGTCGDCLRRDPLGAQIVVPGGWLGDKVAALSERVTSHVQAALPGIAHEAGHSLAQGTVAGIRQRQEDIAQVAKSALDAPVKQRIWATVIGLAGGQIAILISMVYASTHKQASFYQTYRWVFFAIVLMLFLISCVTTSVRLYRVWRAVEKAGHMGTAAKDLARSALTKTLLVNTPLLLLVLALTVVAGILFAMQR